MALDGTLKMKEGIEGARQSVSLMAMDGPLRTDGIKWLVEVPFAHRGFHTGDGIIPENSTAAFKRAIDYGYAIELDVRLSSDGKVVVFHDKSLYRMTGISKFIDDLTWEEIKHIKLLGSRYTIPLLEHVLKLVNGRVPMLIEVKNNGVPGPLEQALIDVLRDYKGHFAVQSFNPLSLRYFKRNAPQIIRGQLSGSFKGENLMFFNKFLLRYLLLNGLSKPSYVAYEIGYFPKWLANLQRRMGIYLLGWTAKSPKDHERAKGIYDNVIFEGYMAQPFKKPLSVGKGPGILS